MESGKWPRAQKSSLTCIMGHVAVSSKLAGTGQKGGQEMGDAGVQLHDPALSRSSAHEQSGSVSSRLLRQKKTKMGHK